MLMILYVFLIVNQMQTKFFEFLNTQHPNIKFTFAKQVNKQISFLDVFVTNDGDQFSLPFSAKKLRLTYLLII